MRILSAKLTNFRCFKNYQIEFLRPFCLIIGSNGTGKTTIIEALHYLCYLKSFKTHIPKELISLDNTNNITNGFAINLLFAESSNIAIDNLYAIFKNNKRTITLNKKAISSYKELFENYKAITITEDDLNLIKGSPSYRRSFIDQFIILNEPHYATAIKNFKQVLLNRNALILKNIQDLESYNLWSQKFLDLSKIIQNKRLEYLRYLQSNINNLINNTLKLDLTVTINYKKSKSIKLSKYNNFSDLLKNNSSLKNQEYRYKRSLWGPHLDDFEVEFEEKNSKTYASRGQQKLIVFLIKAAQLEYINTLNNNQKTGVFLIDDFITDLDENKINYLTNLSYKVATQVILTCPIEHPVLINATKNLDGQIYKI